TQVTCTATDNHGNSTGPVNAFTVTEVQDTTPPVITIGGPTTAEATGPGGANVDYHASASDPDDPVASFSCSPAAGSLFPIGVTPVHCDAADSVGNTSSADFNVTVQDTTPPTIDAHADVSAQTNDPAGTNVTYTPPNAHDIVDGTF